ncbi:MAG: hypothetical protein M3R17_18525 [Bacteroidota bacterium]|nr:hypothetical protein [Bacteroidota bacterium]
MADKSFLRVILVLFAGFLTWCWFHFGFGNEVATNGMIEHKTTSDTVLPIAEKPAEPAFDSLFTFHLNYGHDKDGLGEIFDTIRSIDIIRKKDGVKIQTVIPPTSFYSHWLPLFVIEDMNFDGYLNFRVLDFVPMYACETYHYWLYDPKKDRFEMNSALEVTSNVKFEKESKTITSHFRGGGPFDERNEIFTWENKKLVLQYSEEVFMGIKEYEGTVSMKKRIGRKLVERSKDYDSIPFTREGDIIFNWDEMGQ